MYSIENGWRILCYCYILIFVSGISNNDNTFENLKSSEDVSNISNRDGAYRSEISEFGKRTCSTRNTFRNSTNSFTCSRLQCQSPDNSLTLYSLLDG